MKVERSVELPLTDRHISLNELAVPVDTNIDVVSRRLDLRSSLRYFFRLASTSFARPAVGVAPRLEERQKLYYKPIALPHAL